MPSITGTLNQIILNSDGNVCCLMVNLAGGGTSYKLLWSYFEQDDTAEKRILDASWLALSRDAITNGMNVILVHDAGSSLITGVSLKE